jgi:DNA-binding NtrC family response regulator
MEIRHVLFIDNEKESSKRIRFLLSLLDCKVTTFRYPDECLNWISCRRTREEHFDLIVTNNLGPSPELQKFREMMNEIDVGVPLLAIHKDGKVPEYFPAGGEQDRKVPFTWCHPEDILDAMRCLNRNPYGNFARTVEK